MLENPMHSIHIAFTTTDNIYDAGGVENSIMRIARGLAANYAIQVDILMLDSTGQTTFKPRGNNGVTQLDAPFERVSIFRLTSWTGNTRHEQQWIEMHYALLELAREREYDLMQAFYASTAGFPTVYAAQLLHIPSVVSIRGNDLITDVFHPQRFPYLVWALQNATQITAVSQEGLERARILSACVDKGRVILNSIRPEDFSEGVQELPLSRPVVGSLAVFRNKKGLEVLLSAFRLLLEHFPTAHLLLVGYVIASEQNHFDELVEKYELTGKYTLTGRIPKSEALRYLRAMDVFAFPSLHDGCPNAVLEAMLAGLPIVATRSGALPEMIEDGKEGLLVRTGSAVELCDRLVKMLTTEDGGLEYGQRARERVLTRFSPRQELEAYKELYEACKEIWRT